MHLMEQDNQEKCYLLHIVLLHCLHVANYSLPAFTLKSLALVGFIHCP